MGETSVEVVRRYLADAVEAEQAFEQLLHTFAKGATGDAAEQQLFRERELQIKQQLERLKTRLEYLGGHVSGAKSLLAHLLGFAARRARQSTDSPRAAVHNLLLMFAAESRNVAMYEALAVIADAASDADTSQLVRTIQDEDRKAAQRIWQLLPSAARQMPSQA